MRLLYLSDVSVDSNAANAIQVLHMCYAFAKVGAEVTLVIPANGSDPGYIREIIRREM